MSSLIQKIIEALSNPLPGKSAQLEMAPPGRDLIIKSDKIPRKAAVLLLLYQKVDEWHLVFIKRVTTTGHKHHRGQISFPGGTQDLIDTTFEDTALRETEEEIGIPKQHIKIIGSLTSLAIPISNFDVHPFIGYAQKMPTFVAQPTEVQKVIEVPLRLLLDKSKRKIKDLSMGHNFILKNIPYFDLNGEILWGATAMITNEFLSLLQFHENE